MTDNDKTILRPLPDDGAKWECCELVPYPKPIWWEQCGQPAVCVVVGIGPYCVEHDLEK